MGTFLHIIGQVLVNVGLWMGRDWRGIKIDIAGETWHYRQDRGGKETWLVQPDRQVYFDGREIGRVEYQEPRMCDRCKSVAAMADSPYCLDCRLSSPND